MDPVARHARPAARHVPPLGDRPLQPSVPLLHARRRLRLAAARGPADLRGDRPGRRLLPRTAAPRDPHHRRRAAAPPRSARSRRPPRRPSRGSRTSRSRRTACCWPRRRPISAARGCSGVTVSLDTLRRDRFRTLARADALGSGARRRRCRGSRGLLRTEARLRRHPRHNDDELVDLVEFAREAGAEVRFIEYMDVGGATAWRPSAVVPRDELIARLADRYGPIVALAPASAAAPAERFQLPDGLTFGIIASTTDAVLRHVRSCAADRRRRAAALPLRPARHRSPAAASRRRIRRDARAAHRRRLGRPRRPRRRGTSAGDRARRATFPSAR